MWFTSAEACFLGATGIGWKQCEGIASWNEQKNNIITH